MRRPPKRGRREPVVIVASGERRLYLHGADAGDVASRIASAVAAEADVRLPGGRHLSARQAADAVVIVPSRGEVAA